ncbi:MAG: hypothetical protein O3B90_06630 [Actinomycetota bacterium]|nr:hypothetical protein [Actinomycetota bacterium]
MSDTQPTTAPSRLRAVRRYLGLDRSYHRPTGPSNEDIARERGYLQDRGIAIGPDDDPFDERFQTSAKPGQSDPDQSDPEPGDSDAAEQLESEL